MIDMQDLNHLANNSRNRRKIFKRAIIQIIAPLIAAFPHKIHPKHNFFRISAKTNIIFR